MMFLLAQDSEGGASLPDVETRIPVTIGGEHTMVSVTI